jgi:hypothetical protein
MFGTFVSCQRCSCDGFSARVEVLYIQLLGYEQPPCSARPTVQTSTSGICLPWSSSYPPQNISVSRTPNLPLSIISLPSSRQYHRFPAHGLAHSNSDDPSPHSAIGSFLFGYDSGIISSVISDSYTEFHSYFHNPGAPATGAIVSVFAGGAFCRY